MIQKLSVVVPCYQEEKNIDRFPGELISFFESFPFEKEFILVDDGSTDQTASKLASLRSAHPNVMVLKHARNQGLGAAIRNAFNHSTGDAILTLDSDLTFHPREFVGLQKNFVSGVDCVMGSPLMGQFEGIIYLFCFAVMEPADLTDAPA